MYYSDMPIKSDEDDKLHRSEFSKRLAGSVLKFEKNETFTIGLYGKWGCGKTSIVNMIEEEIHRQQQEVEECKKLVVIRFEPWNFSSCDQLLTQFFLQLSNEFKKLFQNEKMETQNNKVMQEIGEALETYSDAFSLLETIPVFGKLISIILQNGSKYIANRFKGKNKDLSEQKRNIVDLLNNPNQTHRFLIIIDDIDRLNNDQIRMVFQLISSIADFPKITYLIAFDKDIVVRALEKVQEGSGDEYLEKIIQLPVEVPLPLKKQFNTLMYVFLKELYKSIYGSNFYDIEPFYALIYCCMPLIDTIRDMKRICNALEVKMPAIGKEIDFMDMVVVTVLQISVPEVYDWIKNNSLFLLDEETRFRAKKEETEKFFKESISNVISISRSTKTVDKIVEATLECLFYLFPVIESGYNHDVYKEKRNEYLRKNRICCSSKFDRYFVLDLENNTVTKEDIINITEKFNLAKVRSELNRHIKNKTYIDLMQEIMNIVSEICADNSKILIEALLEQYCNYLMEDPKDDNNILSLEYSLLVSKLLLENINSDELKIFIINLINSNSIDYILRLARFISYVDDVEFKDSHNLLNYSRPNEIIETYLDKVEGYLDGGNLFDLYSWKIIVEMLKKYRKSFYQKYVKKEFQNPKNILLFLKHCINKNENSLCLDKIHYGNYFTKQALLNAIGILRENGEFYSLPTDVQENAAAFYLFLHRDDNDSFRKENFDKKEIEDLLSKWEQEDETPR